MSLRDRIVSQGGFAGVFLEEPVFEMDLVPCRKQISMAVWHLSHLPLLPFFYLLPSKYELHPCLWQLFSFPCCLLLLGLQLLYVPGGSDSEIHLLNDPLFLSIVWAQEATGWCLLAKIVAVFKWEHLSMPNYHRFQLLPVASSAQTVSVLKLKVPSEADPQTISLRWLLVYRYCLLLLAN